MSEWQQMARKATVVLRSAVAAVAVMGAYDAWLVALVFGLRLALTSVVALVMVFSAEKAKRVEAIKAVPAVISALLGRQAR